MTVRIIVNSKETKSLFMEFLKAKVKDQGFIRKLAAVEYFNLFKDEDMSFEDIGVRMEEAYSRTLGFVIESGSYRPNSIDIHSLMSLVGVFNQWVSENGFEDISVSREESEFNSNINIVVTGAEEGEISFNPEESQSMLDRGYPVDIVAKSSVFKGIYKKYYDMLLSGTKPSELVEIINIDFEEICKRSGGYTDIFIADVSSE